MPMSHFDNVRVVLAEPNAELRTTLKENLFGLGFKKITATGNLSRVVQEVNNATVDIVIADTALPEGDFNAYVREMRHGHQGTNPFLVVITLVNEPSSAAVHAAINSGTDHVLAKPFTAQDLAAKISELSHARKRFVVTSEYIGPDRRTTHRPGTRPGTMEVPLIDVPNPLHHRLSEHVSDKQVQHSVGTAKLKINEQMVQRLAYQVGWLLDSVMPEIAALNEDMMVGEPENLMRLCDVARDMCERIKGTRYGHVTEICLTLCRMADQAAAEGLSDEDMQLMGRMTEIIGQAFDPDREATAADYQRKVRAAGINVFKYSDSQDLTRKELTPAEVASVAVS